MIQRIQTLFLIGVIGCLIAYLLLPIWEKSDDTRKMALDAYNLVSYEYNQQQFNEVSRTSTFYIAIAAGLAIITSIITIFLYKNRLTQMKMVGVNALLIMGSVATAAYFSLEGEKIINPDVRGEYLIGFYMPVAALLFNVLANKFIRKDEKLVRSVDRIR